MLLYNVKKKPQNHDPTPRTLTNTLRKKLKSFIPFAFSAYFSTAGEQC